MEGSYFRLNKVNHNIPNDLLIDIWLRCDPQMIGKCRCVSREWKEILEGEPFLLQQQEIYSSMQPSFLLHIWFSQWHGNNDSFIRIASDSGKRLYLPPLYKLRNYTNIHIVGSQHGLLCLSYTDGAGTFGLLVWNALTGAIRTIPRPPKDGFPVLLPTLSFVHIPGTANYCIVHTYRKRLDDEFLMYQMYSSEVHQWSRTRGCNGKIHRLGPESVSLDGVVYWLNHSHEETHSPESIISFSVVTHVFNIFNLPPDYHHTCHSLIAYEGRLAVVYLQDGANNQIMSILSLRQRSGDKLSWRIDMNINSVHARERPQFFEGGNLISVTDDMHPGAPGVDGIVVSRFRQDLDFSRTHVSYLGWNQEIEARYLNKFTISMFPV